MSSDEVSMPAALALVIHELATNSAKYGSLSVASGTLDVSCNAHGDEVVITWTERGGPSIRAPAMLEGFGKGPHHPRRREGAASFGQCFHSGRSASSFDGAGCALLTGSDAGNVPSRSSFNLSCVFLSDFCACFGSSACLSFGAGLNFSVIAVLPCRVANASLVARFLSLELKISAEGIRLVFSNFAFVPCAAS